MWNVTRRESLSTFAKRPSIDFIDCDVALMLFSDLHSFAGLNEYFEILFAFLFGE